VRVAEATPETARIDERGVPRLDDGEVWPLER
jgi:hypothetical protein